MSTVVVARKGGTLAIAGILYVTAMTMAAGRDNLLKVGALLFLACALHNTAGFFLGYIFSRLLRCDELTSRTISVEVGMQNSGLAAALAKAHFAQMSLAALPCRRSPAR